MYIYERERGVCESVKKRERLLPRCLVAVCARESEKERERGV